MRVGWGHVRACRLPLQRRSAALLLAGSSCRHEYHAPADDALACMQARVGVHALQELHPTCGWW